MSYALFFAAASLAAPGLAAPAFAQTSIYTCIDAKGRRLTSDRPIIECLDREQKELNSSGTVKRVLKPSMTADEAAAEEERQRRAAEEAVRLVEEKKRNRALITRYPNRATHDRERAQQLGQIEIVITAAHRRTAELEEERKKLQQEAEFYKGDKSKYPPPLTRQFDQNEQLISGQKRFIDNQIEEQKRVNSRFDEELVKLQELWADQQKAAAARAAASASVKR